MSLPDKCLRPTICKAPLSISRVCRYWRDVSVSFSALWTKFFTFYTGRGGARRRNWVKVIIDAWLQRSNALPLDITFICDLKRYDSGKMHRTAEEIITSLLVHQHRWRNVYFDWQNIYFSSSFTGINATNMTMLTSLTLTVRCESDEWETVRANVDISSSPRLKKLLLIGLFVFDIDEERFLAMTKMDRLLMESTREYWSENKDATLHQCF